MFINDTIAAISTPLGEGGIGIIRISGKDALGVASEIVRIKSLKSLCDTRSHTVYYGGAYDLPLDEKIDEVLIIFMQSPRSYTAEDVVEIHCHGGIIPIRRIYELTIRAGARPAEPGEFTKRAFLNGRIDLAQAEAVIDLIRAKTDAGSRAALNQLEGKLSSQIKSVRGDLLEMIAFAEAAIDFPEEEIEEMTAVQIAKRVKANMVVLKDLINTASSGKVLREGLHTVIIGKPNVGKSSLLNALLRENRAIVTDIPGTTRDIIEEYINVRGIPLKIVDTAGVRETEDIIEKIGVEKARELFKKADLVLMMLDMSRTLSSDDRKLLKELADKPCIILLNKADLPVLLDEQEIRDIMPEKLLLRISVTKNEGINLLEEQIVGMVFQGEVISNEGAIVTNVRHQHAIQLAYDSLQDALQTIEAVMPLDCIVVDLRASWEALGQIAGDTLGEDIIDQIFATFCIGK